MKHLFLALALLMPIGSAHAQQFGETVTVDQPSSGDLYLFGRRVEINAPVQGDVVAAGQTVLVNRSVATDLIAVGEHVRIDAPIGDDVRVAGREVDVSANVGDHLVAAGERVDIHKGQRIGGFAWIAGERVTFSGGLGGDLKIAARSAVVSGRIAGNAEIMADHIELTPGARVAGDLIWRSANAPVIQPGAVVQGRIIARPMPAPEAPGLAAVLFGAIVFLAVVLLSAVVIYLIAPGFSVQVAGEIRSRPLKAFLIGMALLVVVPITVFLLLVSMVGALLGLILLALYLVALPLAWFAGAFCTGEWVLSVSGRSRTASRGLQLAVLAISVVSLALLQFVPFIGPVVAAAVTLFGLGGIGLAVGSRYRGAGAPV